MESPPHGHPLNLPSAEALTLRAATCQRQGDLAGAVDWLEQAAALAPTDWLTQKNLAAALVGCGRLDEAQRRLEQALKLDPLAAAAWAALGSLHARRARTPEAAECFRRATELDPRAAGFWHDLGVVLARLDRPLQSREAFLQAAALEPGRWSSAIGAAQQLEVLGCREQAIAELREVAERQPLRPEPWHAQGQALCRAERPSEALAALERAVARDPRGESVIFDRAVVLRLLDRPEEALADCRRLRALGMESAALDQLEGGLHWDRGEFGRACQAFTRAAAMDPVGVEAQLNRASCLLIEGHFDEGWQAYRHRTAAPGFAPSADQRPELPWWQRGPIPRGGLLVLGEQGLGDELMLATCLPSLLAQEGPVAAGPIVWSADRRLLPLLARSFPQVCFVDRAQIRTEIRAGDPWAECQAQVLAGSLPEGFRRRWADFPRQPALLRADSRLVAQWRTRLEGLGPGLKIGVSWRGGPAGREGRLRSLPLAQWQPVMGTPGAVFVSVQYGRCGDEVRAFERQTGHSLTCWPQAQAIDELEEFSALLAALDLVISVPNATVHLAGALGTPTWALVRSSPDWRWFAEGSHCPWYRSVRLVRQPAPGDWQSVLAQVERDLAVWTAAQPPRAVDGSAAAPAWAGTSILVSPEHRGPRDVRSSQRNSSGRSA